MKFRTIKWLILMFFLLGNIIVFNHAYKFTHFSNTGERIRPENLTLIQKLNILFWGIDNPRPSNDKLPAQSYDSIQLQSYELLEGWFIDNKQSKGIVVLFHGYSASKSGSLPYSNEFHKLGYKTLLIDFQGSGGSTGNKTTIGVEESRDVKVAYDYVRENFPNEKVILFGSSMGAASILKSIHDYDILPDKIILECPFHTMKATMQKRFEAMKIPSFPATELLLFYGGCINGFNAFKHNPVDYAKSVDVPTMLLHGQEDQRVLVSEVDKIFQNLNGYKKLVVLEDCGHQVYLNCNSKKWKSTVIEFLDRN